MKALFSGLLLLTFLAGCEEDKAFYIYQNQVPQKGCLVSDDDKVYRSQGLLDVSQGTGYYLFPLLRNDLKARRLSGDTEPNMLHLREFKVDLEMGSLGSGIATNLLRFTRPTSGTLLPQGKRSSVVELVPADLVKKLKIAGGAWHSVIAEVIAVAETGDGETLESIPFYYPVSLCYGCLVTTLSSCPTGASLKPFQSNVCGLPQDAPLLCCNDSVLGLRCIAGDTSSS
jgi:hypothetical protein